MRIYPLQNSSSNSPSGSGQNTAPNSSQPSPLPPVPSNLPVPPEIEPLPPAQITNGVTPGGSSLPNTPLQPNSNNAGSGNPPIPGDHPSADSADHAARTATPRSKFMQTLQSNSAWDALIHGSFSWNADIVHSVGGRDFFRSIKRILCSIKVTFMYSLSSSSFDMFLFVCNNNIIIIRFDPYVRDSEPTNHWPTIWKLLTHIKHRSRGMHSVID